jgi:hypothetical protein
VIVLIEIDLIGGSRIDPLKGIGQFFCKRIDQSFVVTIYPCLLLCLYVLFEIAGCDLRITKRVNS